MADMDMILKFLMAQQEAEEKGERFFTCPICDGEAHWNRSIYNNHLFACCLDCGLKIIE